MNKSLKKILFVSVFFISSFLFATSRDSALYYFNKGLLNQNQEDWYCASENFQQALQLNNSYGEAWFHLAQVTYELNDFSLCLSYLENADKYAKNRTDILNLRGLCYISLGKLEEAENVFNSIIKDFPNNVDGRFGLAELELYNGSFDSATNLYLDALKRQGHNKKALLSLALLSAETGKYDLSEKYIQQALQYHSGEAQVHYLASYLDAKKGKLKEAERRAKAAVQIKPDYLDAYILLASIFYAQNKYDDVIDICDYLINKNRKTISAWYLKGFSQYRKKEFNEAIETWTTALSIDETDEILRCSLELLISDILPLEDDRRAHWAQFHIKKARDYSKRFLGEEARYEYQRALRIDPNNITARLEFAEIINKLGLSELYINQLTFIQENSEQIDPIKKTKLNDTVESYSALMKYSLNQKWNIEPFYLDKTRWNIGVFYKKSPVQLLHCDSEEITSSMISEVFNGIASTSVFVQKSPILEFGEAFKKSRKNKLDYFIIIEFQETEREVSLEGIIYNGKNGTVVKKISLFRTGNDKFSSILRSFRRNVLEILPIRGKILERNGNLILVDLGKSEGIKENSELYVVKKGTIKTNDNGVGVSFDDENLLGLIKIKSVGEEIAEGILTQDSFYDFINIDDEVLIKSVQLNENDVILDTNPTADTSGINIAKKSENQLSMERLGLIRKPAILDIIRNIN